MTRKSIFCFCFLLLLVGFFTAKTGFVYAQSSGIKISPVKVEDIVDPGQIYTGELKIANESESKKIFYVYLKDFKAEDETGAPKIIAPGSEEGYFLASWIDITSEAIEFGPGEEKIIPYKINIPTDAGPGGYFGGIFFGTKPPRLNLESDEDKGAGMSIAQQTGSLILLRVSGEVQEEALIREYTTDKKYYNTPFDVKFNVRIENKGNVHVKPYGKIVIKDMFDRVKDELLVNEKGGNILPKSIRKFSEDWSGKYGFGKYTADIGLTYGDTIEKGGQGKQSLISTITFWIIPWNIVGPFVGGIGVVIVLFFLSVKFYKDRAIKNAIKKAGISSVAKNNKSQNTASSVIHFLMILMIILIILFLLIMGVYFIFFA